tara:strand:+ start:2720 stop:4657 length:1938 start_codon:yes stop_codon:yes gene_type:complete
MNNRVRERSAYDVYVEYNDVKVGFRLAKSEAGVSWQHGLQPLLPEEQRVSGAFEYQQVPAESDVPLGFDNWAGGCGISEVGNSGGNLGYNYSQNIDASYNNRLYLSPKFNEVFKATPSTTIEANPTHLAETSLGVFLCAGRYLYKYDTTDDVFDEVHDLGLGEAFTGPVVEFSSRVYAPAGDSKKYILSSDGATWTEAVASDPYAKFFTARGRSTTNPQMWKTDGSGNTKPAASPEGSGGAWGTAIPLGHTSETVNGMLTADDKVWVFKTEGVFFHDGTNVQDFWTGGRQMRRSDNGKNPLLWTDGFVYVPYGDRLMQIDPIDENFTLLYPADYMLGNTQLNGSITALAGDADWIYLAQKNAAGNTHLVKLNPYRTVHTWAYASSNDCNCLLVASPTALHASNPAVVAGHESTVGYYINPRSGLRPEDDENCTFTADTGVIVGPYINVGAKLFKKFLNAGRVLGQNLSGGMTASLRYEIDNAEPVAVLTAKSAGETFAITDSEVEFNQIRYNLQMDTELTGATPVTRALVLNTVLNPPRKKSWRFSVEVNSGILLSAGGPALSGGNYLESFLFNGVQNRVTLYDRRGDRTFVGRILDVQGRFTDPKLGGDHEIFDITFYEIAETTAADVAIYDKDAYNVAKVYGS